VLFLQSIIRLYLILPVGNALAISSAGLQRVTRVQKKMRAALGRAASAEGEKT